MPTSPDIHLHLVSFDIPYPPDYGGVIDVYYKIKALHELGVKVHLHCFEYGRKSSPELEEHCYSTNIYKRDVGKTHLFSNLPYIVSTRNSKDLIANLLKDEHPIIFEGLHCCFYLKDARLVARRKFVRMHNIEHDYYDSLAKVERKVFKRYYFNRESIKLRRFEKNLALAETVIAISPADASELSSRYENVKCIPAFHSHEKVSIDLSPGKFALYHGNLAVGENNEAAIFLAKKVFNDISEKLIIAGNDASPELKALVKDKSNIQLKDEVSIDEINELVKKAQVNILPTFQATGIKLKLLNALFCGKYCLVNTDMVINTGLEELCIIKNTPTELKNEVQKLMRTPFAATEVKKREDILYKEFSNKTNATRLVEMIR